MKTSLSGKNSGLKTSVEGGELRISIGVNVLAFAVKLGLQGHWLKCCGAITSPTGYAKDILYEILYEREDGSNLLTDLFDKAALEALENGCQHVNFLHRSGKIDLAGMPEEEVTRRKPTTEGGA